MYYICLLYTSGGFEGIGVEGLAWLKEVKKETGMYVSTEVATAKHVYELSLIHIWIKAVEEITYAKEKGIDFIICDHHVPDDVLPPAVAILNLSLIHI